MNVMLACDAPARIRFPADGFLVSPKLDGIRARVGEDSVVYSRSGKPIPSPDVQRLFGRLPAGIEGELICGDPAAPDCFNRTHSIVMTGATNIAAAKLTLWVFDKIGKGTFAERFAKATFDIISHKQVRIIDHIHAADQAALDAFETAVLALKMEGVVLRRPSAQYKYGRATQSSGDFLRIKRFSDGEAVIEGTTEMNNNPGLLGSIQARDLATGRAMDIGGGKGLGTKERAAMWEMRSQLPGLIVKFRHFEHGATHGEGRRFPGLVGFRSAEDMS